MSDGFDRRPPANIDAERACLGSCLLSLTVLPTVASVLPHGRAEFFLPQHGVLYGVLQGYAEQHGYDADPLQLAAHIRQCGQPQLNDEKLLGSLVSSVPSATRAEHYAVLVHDAHRLRLLLRHGYTISQAANDDGALATDVLAMAQASLNEVLACERHRAEGWETMMESLYKDIDSERAVGVPTGFLELDGMVYGIEAGEQWVLAARPGVGKTAFALQIAANMAIHGDIGVLFISIEMNAQALLRRLFAQLANVPHWRLRKRAVYGEEREYLDAARERIEKSHLQLACPSAPTIEAIQGLVQTAKRQHDIRIVIIDYLQLMRGRGRAENENIRLTEISAGLKSLAKRVEVGLITLSQLSRAGDDEPRLIHLRGSGAIEQDADTVLLLHREMEGQFYAPATKVVVAKARNAQPGSVKLYFDGEYQRFTAVEDGLYSEPSV